MRNIDNTNSILIFCLMLFISCGTKKLVYYEDGKSIKSETVLRNNKERRITKWNDEGILISIRSCISIDTFLVDADHPSEQFLSVAKSYYLIKHDSQGKILLKGMYVKGKKQGKWKYSKNGKCFKKQWYNSGELIKEKILSKKSEINN